MIYVIVAGGRRICAFAAEDIVEAQEAIDDVEGFSGHLMAMETNGQPLWDGSSKLDVDEATPAERGRAKPLKKTTPSSSCRRTSGLL